MTVVDVANRSLMPRNIVVPSPLKPLMIRMPLGSTITNKKDDVSSLRNCVRQRWPWVINGSLPGDI